jgi:hypothetical protein
MAADDKPKRPGFGKVVGKAATQTGSLVVMGAAGVAAAALASWPILAVGGAAYAALVAWDIASPDFWKKALGGGGQTRQVALPEPDDVKDPLARRAIQQIAQARAEIAKVLAETSADVTSHLGTAVVSVDELVQRAATLVARTEDLARYLAGRDGEALRREIGELEGRAGRTRDVDAKRELAAALAARQAEEKTLEEIADARDRATAHLARIAATLAGMAPKIVKMRALDAQAMDDLGGSVAEELDKMNADVSIFEAALASLAKVAV